MQPSPITRTLFDAWFSLLPQAQPFLRWAGGKRTFLIRYGKVLPNFSGRYIDPFLGGGSVFLYIVRKQSRPFQALLGDINVDLIQMWRGVHDDPEGVYRRLEALQKEYSLSGDKAAFYYALRDTLNGCRPRIDPAVFIFVNRLCWNGLYRTNAQGKFNVPYGSPKSDNVLPAREGFFAAAAALVQAELRACSWENVVSLAEPGDLVFLDPPYVSDIHADDVKYGARQFSIAKHERLAAVARSMSDRNIAFVLTNSGEPETQELYQSLGLKVQRVVVPRSINSKADLRNPVHEIIVTPHSAPWIKEKHLVREK